MRMPQEMPSSPNQAMDSRARRRSLSNATAKSGLAPAGCCVQTCAPLIGCTCLVSSPIC